MAHLNPVRTHGKEDLWLIWGLVELSRQNSAVLAVVILVVLFWQIVSWLSLYAATMQF